jgi:hypothetical protein
MRLHPIALCLGLSATSSLAFTAHAQYKLTVLQNAGGAGLSEPLAINAVGESVGYSWTGGQGADGPYADAVLWSSSGTATVLQDAGGHGKDQANAINASGESVGYSVTATGVDAVLWSASGRATVLQAPGDYGPYGIDIANAVNAFGQIAGTASVSPPASQDAVLWSDRDGSSTGPPFLQHRGRNQRLRAERRIFRLRAPLPSSAVVAFGKEDRASGRRRRGSQRSLRDQRLGR